MAQAGLTEIMDAMAVQLRYVYVTANSVDVQVEPRLVVNPSPPTIDIYPGDLFRDRESAAFDDISGGYRFTVRARVSTADSYAGQDLLLAFMDDTDPLCMAAALGDEPTLDGYVASLSVEEPTGYVMYPDAGGEGVLLGCQWPVLAVPGNS
jgi:hypothetical protein